MKVTVVLFILLHFSFCTSTPTCPKGEVYNSCGSACPPTCNSKPEICTDQCVPGCFCANGLVKNQHGACVSQKLADLDVEEMKKVNPVFETKGPGCESYCSAAATGYRSTIHSSTFCIFYIKSNMSQRRSIQELWFCLSSNM
ncbi:Hemolectin [Carabus blaptoides fortunei]